MIEDEARLRCITRGLVRGGKVNFPTSEILDMEATIRALWKEQEERERQLKEKLDGMGMAAFSKMEGANSEDYHGYRGMLVAVDELRGWMKKRGGK